MMTTTCLILSLSKVPVVDVVAGLVDDVDEVEASVGDIEGMASVVTVAVGEGEEVEQAASNASASKQMLK